MKKTKGTAAARRSVRRAGREATVAAEHSQSALRDVWKAAVEAFNAAEGEATKQVRSLVKSGRLTANEAADNLAGFSARLQKERKKAMKQFEGRVASLQSRLDKERKVLGKTVDEAVRSALAAFNIPSRREVSELTRKVDELSSKIDGFRRSARKSVARRTTRARRSMAAAA
jgi:poly(hydroxyalkanoate) granule-associated protein